MANSTIKFPQEMPTAANINGSDKIMVADATTNEAKSATWDAAKQYLNITGIELKPVPAGALPAGPADQERKMQITDAGTWTYGGSSFVNPDGSVMILWWSGSAWSIADQYYLPTVQGVGVLNPTGQSVPKEEAVADYVEPLFDLTIPSENLIDKNKLATGRCVIDGSGKISVTPTDNWVNIQITSGFQQEQKYFLQGCVYPPVSTTTTDVILFSDENDNIISTIKGGSNYVNPFVIPIGTTTVSINVDNTPSSGLNPTECPSAPTAMLSKGEVVSPYIPYRVSLDGQKVANLSSDKILDFNSAVSLTPSVSENKSSIDFIMSRYTKAYLYDGTGRTNFTTTRLLDAEGDYVEFFARNITDVVNVYDNLGLIGTYNDPSKNILGYYGAYNVQLRDSAGGSYKTWVLPDPSSFKIHKIKLTVASGNNWELFYNDVSLGFQEKTGSFSINCIGGAYNPAILSKAEVEKVTIQSNGVEEVFDNLINGIGVTSQNVTVTYIEGQADKDPAYPESLYEYSPTMFDNRKGLKIYTKLNGSSDIYLCFNILHQLDTNPIVYADYYRMAECRLNRYNGEIMEDLNKQALTFNENEFTMKQRGKVDHTGGIHGDEQAIRYSFMPNGIEILDLNTAIPLTPIKDFKYQVFSNLTETANSESPTTPIPGHPIIATHAKTTYIGNSGYTCQNVVTFKQSIDMERAYTGLVCMAKNFAEKGFTEYGVFSTINDKDDSSKFTNPYSHTFYGEGPEGSCEIFSEVLHVHKPGNNDCAELYRNYCSMWVADRLKDSKYYRTLGKHIASLPNIVTEVGEIWDFKACIKYTSK